MNFQGGETFMSTKIITMEDLLQALDVLNKIYDSVRIVKPLKKKIIDISKGVTSETEYNCYDFWSHGGICNNCISMRAFNKKDIFTKLDWLGNKTFMVIAVPIQDKNETVILELLKDISENMNAKVKKSAKNNSLLQTLYEIGQLQIRDSLTGIYNRRFIDERLPVDILSINVDSTPFSIIFTDIDHFKLVNDTYGHVAGDHILKEFAQLLQKSITTSDNWVARYGGEEFLIYLKNSDITTSKKFAEKLRNDIQKNEFYFEGNTIRITSSFGVCTVHQNNGISTEQIIEFVDKNLYMAKTSGRNKVVASEIL